MKDNAFSILQKLGKTFMLPIALLPIAGLMLGIGASYPNLAINFGLPGEGSLLFKFFTVLNDCGNIVFSNLALFFAVAAALGFANKAKEVAALSAVVAYFLMYAAMTSVIANFRDIEVLNQTSGLITSYLGFNNTMNLSVFGGVVVGLVAAYLHNRFYKINLPDSLSFFSGTRFVPIICAVAGVVLGFIFAFLWPYVAYGISTLGTVIANLGPVGTFIYAYIYRALIPLGLHHVFYLPFWQTSLGGTAIVAGELVEGAQNIIFARLSVGEPTYSLLNLTGANPGGYFSGWYPLMMFAYPAIALAMYKMAKPEKKVQAKGIFFTAALTSLLTGITEPLEFSFLFVSPFLYFGVVCILAGISAAICNILAVGVGVTFSAGIIDFILYGILPGNDITHWLYIIPIGIVYAVIGYFLFIFFIKKFDLKTPGREDDEEVRLINKAEYLAHKEGVKYSKDDELSAQIILGLGGSDNLVSIDNCATRLRVTVDDPNKVNEGILKASGSAGILRKGKSIQVIYGGKVVNIRTNIDEFMSKGYKVKFDSAKEVENPKEVEEKPKQEDKQEKSKETLDIYSVAAGTVINLEQVKDEVFSQKVMGDGYAVQPSNGLIYSPVSGSIISIFPTKHAIGIKTEQGIEILVHMGIDTVDLKGEPFEVLVKEGEIVTHNSIIAKMSLDDIKKASKYTDVIVLVTNMDIVSKLDITGLGDKIAKEKIGNILIK